jgi:hypothetical protein
VLKQIFLLEEWDGLTEKGKSETTYRLLQFAVFIHVCIIILASLTYDIYGKPWMFLAGILAFFVAAGLVIELVDEWQETRELEDNWGQIAQVADSFADTT